MMRGIKNSESCYYCKHKYSQLFNEHYCEYHKTKINEWNYCYFFTPNDLFFINDYD